MSQNTPPSNRRERQRADTVCEIKTAARARLVESGPAGFSLRAVARDVGMSAPALYRYFPSFEALVVDLVADLYNELRTHMETECDRLSADDLISRLFTAARAFRDWAITHRVEFATMFASLTPGATFSGPDTTSDMLSPETEPYRSMLRFCGVFGDLINRIYWQSDSERGFTLRVPPAPEVSDALRAEVNRCQVALGIDASFAYTMAFHSYWVRLYGLVAMEVFGHMPIVDCPRDYFEVELTEMATRLGMPKSVRNS